METRIQKYKNYRAALVKEGSATLKEDNTPKTTTALPLNEVMASSEVANTTDLYYKKQQRFRVIQFAATVLLFIAIVVALIIFGIYAWR